MIGRKRNLGLLAVACVMLLAIYVVGRSGKSPTMKKAAGTVPNAVRIANLLAEMERVDLDSLAALPVERFALPNASVDVMRVRLEETYDIAGIGRDTVELKGWIAVKHDDARPAAGESSVKWGTAVSNTEFVGMDLKGESKIFGPVAITLNPDLPSKGQVGKLDLAPAELQALHAAYVNAIAAAEPQRKGSLTIQKGYEGILDTLDAVRKAIEAGDPKAMLRQYDQNPDNSYFNAGAGKAFRGAKNYIDFLTPGFTATKLGVRFDNVRVIGGTPGSWATIEVTGHNTVVKDSEGRSGGDASFHLTQVYVRSGARWLIKYDSWALAEDPTAISIQGASSKAACRAAAAVSIKMPRLDLIMTTKNPVIWYSEVETIPPVGYTASISYEPTPVVSNNRTVGTLVSGIVKFREVVRKVDLDPNDTGRW